MSNHEYKMLVRRRITRRNHIRISQRLESTITRNEIEEARKAAREIFIPIALAAV